MVFLNKYAGVLASIAIVIALVGFFPTGSDDLGAGTRFPNGISADSTAPSAGQVRGTTLLTTGNVTLGDGGDSVTIATAANATSSLTVGCINYYATSSATAGKLVFVDSATSSINGTAAGLLGFKYGSCP